MKILLLGANGQLGVELQKVLPKLGEVIALTRNELDLSDLNTLIRNLDLIKPNLIVNASAYTSVDKAQKEKELAMRINSEVPRILANFSFKNDSPLIHYSTDYVFDGTKKEAYLETDEPNPLNIYGLSKFHGEQHITNSECKHLIFRTSWLFSAHGQNFMTTILKLASEKKELKIINDQWGIPTSCQWLAEVTLIAINVCLRQISSTTKNSFGIYHATPNGITNWYEYAKLIINIIEMNKVESKFKLKSSDIFPILSKEYEQLAKRPKFSVLNNEKLINEFSLKIDNFERYISNELKAAQINTY